MVLDDIPLNTTVTQTLCASTEHVQIVYDIFLKMNNVAPGYTLKQILTHQHALYLDPPPTTPVIVPVLTPPTAVAQPSEALQTQQPALIPVGFQVFRGNTTEEACLEAQKWILAWIPNKQIVNMQSQTKDGIVEMTVWFQLQ